MKYRYHITLSPRWNFVSEWFDRQSDAENEIMETWPISAYFWIESQIGEDR